MKSVDFSFAIEPDQRLSSSSITLFLKCIDKNSFVINNFTGKLWRKDPELDFVKGQQTISRGGHSVRCQRGRRQEASSAQTSSRNKEQPNEMVQQSTSQDVNSRVALRYTEQCSFFSNVGSEYDVTDLSQASDAIRRMTELVSHGCSDSDASAKNVELAFKLNATKLKTEKLWLTLTQNEVTTKNNSKRHSIIDGTGRIFWNWE